MTQCDFEMIGTSRLTGIKLPRSNLAFRWKCPDCCHECLTLSETPPVRQCPASVSVCGANAIARRKQFPDPDDSVNWYDVDNVGTYSEEQEIEALNKRIGFTTQRGDD